MTSFLIIDDHPLFRDALGNAIRLAHTDARILEAMSTFGSRGWAQIMVAVGTRISPRPPHRSRRALLTHRDPTLDGDEEPLFGPRVQDAWERQVPVSDLLHSRPR